jgi:OHCU decarboxylase
MTPDEVNALDRDAAEQLFLRCCGSTRWAREMAARRPFRDAGTIAEAADRIWRDLGAADWNEAFAAHPRIGESHRAGGAGGAGEAGRAGEARGTGEPGADWSAREQAGMDDAIDVVRHRLAAANLKYEARFGFIYIVCATGKTASQMLEMLERRLTHSAREELGIAAEEQRKITRLRLAKLLS